MSKTIYYQNKQIELKYGRINHLIPADMWQCGLSLQAIGVASYIYTLPKEWKLSVSHIAKQLMISPNSCRKYLREIFTNPKAIKVFKGVEREANTYDLEEGFYEYPYVDEQEEVANFTSSVAKDVSVPRKRRVLIVQTETQRYLLNLCFARGKVDSSMDRHADKSARDDDKKVDSSSEITPNKNAQNLRTINKNLLQDSYKDSSSKRTREKTKTLEAQKFTTSFSTRDGFCDDFTRCADSSAEIRLGCLSHKRESNSRKRAQKTSDLTSEQLRDFKPNEQEAIKLWIRYKQESSKARLKPSQIDFQLRKIQRLKEQGQDICAVIEKSVDMGWQGLFPVIASETKQSINADSSFKAMDRHADKSARDDRKGAFATARDEAVGITPKMPKNIGGKTVLKVVDNA